MPYYTLIAQIDTKDGLVEYLRTVGDLQSPLLLSAFSQIDRADFVPDNMLSKAYFNCPLPIGYEQTISQPYTVAFMLELLSPEPGNNILDIGTGSGWTTALLKHCVGSTGRVLGLERIPQLVSFGQKNLQKYFKQGAAIRQATPHVLGVPGKSFNRILVSAAATEVPRVLFDQLADKGVLVLPVDDTILRIEKNADKFSINNYPGFSFVNLLLDPTETA